MGKRDNIWTADELATVKQKAIEGLSGAQIASYLPGRTRNAVIGALHRMGSSCKGSNLVFWTAERDAELVRLVNEGMGHGDIAEQMGSTRKSVGSRLCRLRAKSKAPPADTSTRYRPGKITKKYSTLTGMPITYDLKGSPAPRCVAVDANPRRLKFLELQSCHCRFILDDRDALANMDSVYCGADTVKDGSWCGPHRQVVFQAR